MAVFKCKMCGGNLEVQEGMTVCECEYCGSKQTVPHLDDEKKINLFTRANRLRSACEFDKASGVYESLVGEFPEEAEAYWGLLLCRYGIEYVDDPKTGRKIPTCHRSSFDSIMDDPNFEMVLECSDPISRAVYREEAKAIEALRNAIIEVSSKEEPYDIFICYKEIDIMGERTIDSVIAQDVYDALTEKGYKVFFSRITLESKLGEEYEPYIFAALNSAKVMLAFGTDYEHYNAVWVKNEWSRFLSLIEKGEKKTLIPCFKDIDAYDMPKEFARLQAQDMGKVGAIQDLLRGIEKIVKGTEVTPKNEQEQSFNQGNTEPLLKRAQIFLEDKDWKSADEYCEKVLDFDPENCLAYIYKLMAKVKCSSPEELKHCDVQIGEDALFSRITKYANEAVKTKMLELANYNAKYPIYKEAIEAFEQTNIEYLEYGLKLFEKLGAYEDASTYATKCRNKIKSIKYKEAQAEAERKHKVEESLKDVTVGKYVYFGKYKQDNSASKGEECIEWLVLDEKDGKALLISKYALDCKEYNTEYVDVTWETCTLRKWLNSDFIKSAFSDEERARIHTVTVSADKNPECETDPGKATQDQVFLLSITEADKYLSSMSARYCEATAYAERNKLYVGGGKCEWWLRSPGRDQSAAVYADGFIIDEFGDIADNTHAVRPALWIDLESPAMVAYKEACLKIEAQISDEIEVRSAVASEEINSQTQEIQRKIDKLDQENVHQKQVLEQQISSWRNQQASLGLFKGKEKKELQTQIDDAQKKISTIPTREQVTALYQDEINQINSSKKAAIEKITAEIRAQYKMPKLEDFEALQDGM